MTTSANFPKLKYPIGTSHPSASYLTFYTLLIAKHPLRQPEDGGYYLRNPLSCSTLLQIDHDSLVVIRVCSHDDHGLLELNDSWSGSRTMSGIVIKLGSLVIKTLSKPIAVSLHSLIVYQPLD